MTKPDFDHLKDDLEDLWIKSNNAFAALFLRQDTVNARLTEIENLIRRLHLDLLDAAIPLIERERKTRTPGDNGKHRP